ncbi:hypothetical protein [Lentibacillus salicampi]|uniref:Transposase (putative) YhgA-like domain-containing protein n=1 Tax=Lentibacillus salicampi TaxID=175306 RepID=A0A4Y9AGW0_9BACI|nr:hypothetical protein [Lentibacillus salicampi]TFJ94200.1 hypothetical protein E4U82_02790 [Lentibacillus salicampi]
MIHIEVQGEAGEDFGKQMFQYFYRIYDKFDREVYALALITDHEAENANGFHYSFYDTKVDYTYHVYRFQDKNITKLEQSANPFAHAVIAGIYASKTKNDSDARYAFKRKLMIQVLQKFSTQQEDTRTYLSTLFYFIDYLLQVPKDLSKKLADDVIPYMGEEVIQKMEAEKTNPSQTLEEIFAELREEGKVEGKTEGRKDALKHVVQELVREGYSNERIVKITKLNLEEVKELRRTFERN